MRGEVHAYGRAIGPANTAIHQADGLVRAKRLLGADGKHSVLIQLDGK